MKLLRDPQAKRNNDDPGDDRIGDWIEAGFSCLVGIAFRLSTRHFQMTLASLFAGHQSKIPPEI